MTPAESMQAHLAELSEDMAKSVEAQTETSRSLETMTQNQKLVMAELVDLRAEVQEMIGLFKTYVKDTAALRSEVREKLRVVPNG